MVVAVKEKIVSKEEPQKNTEPTFRNSDEMTIEELTDPDYRLKQVVKHFGSNKESTPAICSKCHHCRR